MKAFGSLVKARSSKARTDPAAQPSEAPAYVDVLIPREGEAVINGKHLRVTDEQSVHSAVLDTLHQSALSLKQSVVADITDHPIEAAFRIEVAPDGSSRVLERSTPWPVSDASSDLDSGVGDVKDTVGEESAASAARGEITRKDAGTGTTRTISPVRLLPGRVVPPVPIPDHLASSIRHINELLEAGYLNQARVSATALREELTRDAGAEHPDALEARSLEAFITYLQGDHRNAVVLTLAVARIRCQQQDPSAIDDATRATAIWQKLSDVHAVATHGSELLRMWHRLAARMQLTTWHAVLTQYIEQRLHENEEKPSYATWRD
ncbi:hypothetical protein AB0I54_42030 [Streptomyces sp. NPDC050625]|uniref:hypothetical protein n=1 Tax=Streptomyces sp. NPDC050625 TaxID=3154629 RepID=UPI0034499B55